MHTNLGKLLESNDRKTICSFQVLLGYEPHIFMFSILISGFIYYRCLIFFNLNIGEEIENKM
jgi:hypothetical protein